MRKLVILSITLVLAALTTACQPVTPTPTESPPTTPTPVSPLPSPTPPVSPLAVPQAADFVYSAWWDEWAHCVHTGVTPTLKVAVKWLGSTMIYSETLDTGQAAPPITGTGQFNGDFMPSYPTPDEDVGEWARMWWSVPGGGPWHCFDEWGSLVEVDEVEAPWFEGGSQDAEGYWFIREVAAATPTPTPSYVVYAPLSFRGGEPTSTPEAGSGSDGEPWRTVGWALVGVAGIAAIFGAWYLIHKYVLHKGVV